MLIIAIAVIGDTDDISVFFLLMTPPLLKLF